MQDRDIPRHNEIVSQLPALLQAGHSAYSGYNTQNCFRNPNESDTRLDSGRTGLDSGSTVWCYIRNRSNIPLEVVQDVERLFRYAAGYPDPANRARLLERWYLIKRVKKTTRTCTTLPVPIESHDVIYQDWWSIKARCNNAESSSMTFLHSV